MEGSVDQIVRQLICNPLPFKVASEKPLNAVEVASICLQFGSLDGFNQGGLGHDGHRSHQALLASTMSSHFIGNSSFLKSQPGTSVMGLTFLVDEVHRDGFCILSFLLRRGFFFSEKVFVETITSLFSLVSLFFKPQSIILQHIVKCVDGSSPSCRRCRLKLEI